MFRLDMYFYFLTFDTILIRLEINDKLTDEYEEGPSRSVVSKFLNEKLKTVKYPRGALSKSIVSAAALVYVGKLIYPHLAYKFKNNQSNVVAKDLQLNSLKKHGERIVSPSNDDDNKIKQILKTSLEKIPGLNIEFLYQLKFLINIMIPKFVSFEVGLLLIHTLCLISRTFLSIYVATMEGAIVRFIVQKKFREFAFILIKWFGIAIPATFINSMIRYLENTLALAFRTRLVEYSYSLYFKNQTYYRVSNLDSRIENAEHRLTDDISVFSTTLAHLYSHITKPCFDLMLIGLAMARSSQKMNANIFFGPSLAIIVIVTTGYILRIVSPKFGQLVSEEANRYGYLRHIHSRIITNAEEIAFYGGHKVEYMQLRQSYERFVHQMKIIFKQKLWFIMLEQFFMKYVWSGMGMIMISLPILTTNNELATLSSNDRVSNRTEYLTTARNLLISGADAVERLMSSYKEIVALAGYTNRVAEMFKVFTDVADGNYVKVAIESSDTKNKANDAGMLEYKNGQPVAIGKIIYIHDPAKMFIHLDCVPIVTPNCDVVVPNLTLTVKSGMHLLITGPNGCGKSSLFRIISGLWPIYNGTLYLPKPTDNRPAMFYIPQRPYMSIGSLRDQIIYPDTRADMKRKNISEKQLNTILKMVSLEHIVMRNSFDEIRDWKDILSGGEKQRMAMARLFYHRPLYALLDECTSAVSMDVENLIYQTVKEMGITLLTITHRPSLWKFHTHKLVFDGQGGWKFDKLDENDSKTKNGC